MGISHRLFNLPFHTITFHEPTKQGPLINIKKENVNETILMQPPRPIIIFYQIKMGHFFNHVECVMYIELDLVLKLHSKVLEFGKI
jgi:hypothetical protein